MAIKILKDRTEIAKAINGRELPVVTIDIANTDEYGLVSEPVLIDNGTFDDGFPYMIDSEIRIYTDEKKFTFSSGGLGIHSSFGYYDVKKMLDRRNAPVIKKDSDVLVCVINSNTEEAFAPMILHTTDRINAHCQTPLSFVEPDPITNRFFLEMGGRELEKKGKKYL